jgi:hypothetical protein
MLAGMAMMLALKFLSKSSSVRDSLALVSSTSKQNLSKKPLSQNLLEVLIENPLSESDVLHLFVLLSSQIEPSFSSLKVRCP